MKKIIISLCVVVIAFASCKKKPVQAPVEVEITPVEVAPDTVAADTASFEYEYEVVETPAEPEVNFEDLNSNHKYFVIVGSFDTRAEAEGYVGTLKRRDEKGMVVQRNRGLNMEKFRVACFSSDNKKTAYDVAEDYKYDYPDAWILIK